MAIIKISDGLLIGNQYFMRLLAVDSDGNPITNLAAATAILFMIKNKSIDADSAAIISKIKTDMTLNDPTPGYITFFINAPNWFVNTAEIGDRPMALQLNYSTDNHQEVYLKENLTDTEFLRTVKLLQDTIRG